MMKHSLPSKGLCTNGMDTKLAFAGGCWCQVYRPDASVASVSRFESQSIYDTNQANSTENHGKAWKIMECAHEDALRFL